MPDIEFGRVGRFHDREPWTFMVICRTSDDPWSRRRNCADVLILEGSVRYLDKEWGPGDIGPLILTDKKIEWLT